MGHSEQQQALEGEAGGWDTWVPIYSLGSSPRDKEEEEVRDAPVKYTWWGPGS